MWYSYKQAVEVFGKDRADELFNTAWVSKWRVKLTEEDKKNRDYISLSESAHGKILHKYLDDNNLFHSHFWNEAGLSWSKYVIIAQARKKALWTSKWFPDYYIIINLWDYSINLFIELKKAKWKQWWLNWSSVSVEQIEWIKRLNKPLFTIWKICHWSEESIEYIEYIISITKWKDFLEINDIIKNEQFNNTKYLDNYNLW